MIGLIYILLAVFFNSVMDKTKDTIQFNNSVFKELNPKFWNDEAWQGKFLPFTKYKLNAWHISKSLMVFFFCASISDSFYEFVAYGIIWNVVFDLFYEDILTPKKNAD